MLQQWTLTNYLMSGEYDRHLQVLRKTLRYNCERMRALIPVPFPKEVCISQPQGGGVCYEYVVARMLIPVNSLLRLLPKASVLHPVKHFHQQENTKTLCASVMVLNGVTK